MFIHDVIVKPQKLLCEDIAVCFWMGAHDKRVYHSILC